MKLTKFRDFKSDFANWFQKSSKDKIGQIFKVFLSIKCYKTEIKQIINYQKLQKLIKLAFISSINRFKVFHSALGYIYLCSVTNT